MNAIGKRRLAVLYQPFDQLDQIGAAKVLVAAGTPTGQDMQVEIAPILCGRPWSLMPVGVFGHVSGSERFERLLRGLNALLAADLNWILPFRHHPPLDLRQFTGGR